MDYETQEWNRILKWVDRVEKTRGMTHSVTISYRYYYPDFPLQLVMLLDSKSIPFKVYKDDFSTTFMVRGIEYV